MEISKKNFHVRFTGKFMEETSTLDPNFQAKCVVKNIIQGQDTHIHDFSPPLLSLWHAYILPFNKLQWNSSLNAIKDVYSQCQKSAYAIIFRKTCLVRRFIPLAIILQDSELYVITLFSFILTNPEKKKNVEISVLWFKALSRLGTILLIKSFSNTNVNHSFYRKTVNL